MASALGRMLALVQSVVLGYLLTASDYGAFAVASGALMFTGLFRSGGIWMVLGSISEDEYRSRGPAVFWVGLFIGTFSLIVTIATIGIGGIQNAVPGASLVLLVLAFQYTVLPIQQFAQMRLGGTRGYGTLSITLLICGVGKLALAISAAEFGFGPLALVVPPVLGTLIEGLLCLRAAKMDRSYFRFEPAAIWKAFLAHLPVLPIAALNSVNTQGDYFIGSLFLTSASLGLYTFAYQIASQPYLVLTMALQRVLVPRSASSLTSAQHNDYLASMATTVFFAVPAVCIGLGISFPLIERVVWGGRWAQASDLVTILSVGLSGPLALAILITPLLAARRYSIVLVSESIRAASVLCGGALGALVLADVPWLQGDPLAETKGLALGVCLVTTISSVGTGVWLLTAAGLRLRPMIQSLLVGPIACTLAGYGSWSIANSLVLSFDSLSSRRGAALVAIIELLIYSLILLGALQLLPPLRAAYINVAEPGLGGLKRFAQRLHLPVGD
jgi:O-antigen/teichoic acid export membrane protein